MTAPLFYLLYERPLKKKNPNAKASVEVKEVLVDTSRTIEDIPLPELPNNAENKPNLTKDAKSTSLLTKLKSKLAKRKQPTVTNDKAGQHHLT